MPRYVVLYRASPSTRDRMLSSMPDETKAGMDAWVAWATGAGSALIEGGGQLARVAQLGAAVEGADDDSVSGFSIIEADTVETVTALLSNHPHLKVGSISVMEARFQYHKS